MLMAVGLLISSNAWGAKIAAKIGSNSYETLEDAVDAANTLAAGGENVIITIISQGGFIEGSCDFPWKINESMTIDLNGEIISYAAFEVAEGKVLTITDNVGDGRFESGWYLFGGDGKYTFPNGFVLGSEWDTPTDCNGDAMIASYFEGKLEGCTAADQQDGTIIFSASSAEEPNCTINGKQRKNITSLDKIPSGTNSIVFDEKQDLTLKATKTLSDITINLGGNTVEMEENQQFQIDGTVIIQNGNLEGTYATSGLIQMNTDANLILENVTMKNKKSDGYTVMVSGVNNTSLTLTGSTAVRHTIYAHNGSETITINGCTVDFTDCEFTPTNDLTLINNGTLKICGGNYEGTLNTNSTVGTVNVDETCGEGDFNAAYQDAFFPEKVAKVNGKEYTLNQAFDEAQDGGTVTLTKNVTLRGTLTISKNVTLDLGKFTMTTGDKKISIDNNVTIQNGTLKNNSGKYAIYANSDAAAITLGTGLTFDCHEYAIEERQSADITVAEGVTAQVTFTSGQGTSFTKSINITNAGTLTIEAGTLQQLAINNSGSCTIKSATIADQITFAGSTPVVILNGQYQGATISGDASVQGGYFKLADKDWLEANHLAEGSTYTRATLNSVEVYKVAPKSNFVAQVGEYKFTALKDAIQKVPTGTETVVELLQNCEANQLEIPVNKNIVLNCNLYTITNSNKYKNNESSGSNFPVLKVSGTLTLNGSANVDNTIVGGIDGVNYGVMTVESASAQITINSGKYQAHDNMAIIEINQDANLVINGGEFIGGSIGRKGMVVRNESNNPHITINGGKFDANITKIQSGITQGASLITTRGNGTIIEINDGEFTIQYSGSGEVPYTNACVDVRGANATEGTAELIINGGSFKNLTAEDKANNNALTIFAYENTKKVVIKGGTFESNGDVAHIKANNTDVKDAAIQNASFISKNGIALKFCSYSNGETYNINGGTYQGTHGIVVFGTKSATVNINDCAIDATICGVQCQGLSVVNIVGGSIESDGKGVEYYQGSYTTADGTINIGGSASVKAGTYGVYNDKGTINVTGGRIWGETKSVFNTKYLECAGLQGTVEVTGGVFNIRPVPEGYIVREETSASAPKRAASDLIIGGGDGTPPGGKPEPKPDPDDPTPPCDPSVQVGNATILGVGLDVITNPDKTTLAMGYLYTVGRQEKKGIQPTGETTDWGTASTWTDGDIPTISDDVTIPAGTNVVVGGNGHTDAVAGTVTIEGTSESNQGNLRVRTGNSLTVENLLTVGDPSNQYGQAVVEAGGRLVVGNASDQMIPNIILEDDGEHGTGVMLFNPETTDLGNIQATIELRTNAHKNSDGTYFWNYIGIPLKLNSGEFTSANWEKLLPDRTSFDDYSYLQTWDFTEGWVNKGFEAFEQFKGVAITNDSESGVIYRFKGTMVGNADKNMEFKPRGYNFFANSYTAPIDIQTLLTELQNDGVADAVVYMFDTENNRFADVSLGAFSGFHAPYFRVIPTMNGFFILNQKYQSSNRTLDYGDAVYNCALGNRPIYAPKHEAMNFSRVHINVETNGSKDGLYLIENDEFTSEFENGYDVIKYMTEGQSNIYAQTTAGRQSELFNSNIEGTMIGFQSAANQTMYTLSFDEVQGETFMLTDMVTGEMVVMNEDNTYTFFAQAGQSNDNRFMVTRVNKAPTAIDNVKGNVKAQGIYSVMGHYFGNVTEWNRLPQGVYMVNGVKVVKY